jgi:hypothetical protein
LLASYFRKRGIDDFEIEEINLQINGKFLAEEGNIINPGKRQSQYSPKKIEHGTQKILRHHKP